MTKSSSTLFSVDILNCVRKQCFILPTNESGVPDGVWSEFGQAQPSSTIGGCFLNVNNTVKRQDKVYVPNTISAILLRQQLS